SQCGAVRAGELEFNARSRWVDENVPQIRVPSVSIGALGDQPYVRCAHRHRGLLGTAARVDWAFAVAWTMSGVAYRRLSGRAGRVEVGIALLVHAVAFGEPERFRGVHDNLGRLGLLGQQRTPLARGVIT